MPARMDVPRYAGMHHRVSRRRGKARDYACVFGGDHPAQHWAWMHVGPEAVTVRTSTGATATYGLRIEDYAPVCARHHYWVDHGLTDHPVFLAWREAMT